MSEAGALTVGQEALWYLQGAAPDSSAYNVVFAVRMLGGLVLEAAMVDVPLMRTI